MAITLSKMIQSNCHKVLDSAYGYKEVCTVLRNSLLKWRSNCAYKYFDEILLKKGQ
jgi:hypothetical protein